MNLKEIKDLIQMMNEHDLVELEIEREGLKVRLVKGEHGKIVPHLIEASGGSPVETTQAMSEKGATPSLSPNAVTVKAPMVGTFYVTPSPDAAPFIEVGNVVEEGQVICIIEAMKLMNEIKSEVKGKVTQLLVENGQPVEFGQGLFIIEKNG